MIRTCIAVALCVAGAGVAQAHAILENAPVATGATGDFAIRIGHGCDGQPVTGVILEIPEGVERVAPMVKPGWTVEATTPREVRWSGGMLPDGQFDRFVFRARVTAQAGAELPFKVRQICPTAEVYWGEVAASGVDPHSLPSPAPVLTVAGGAASMGGHGHAAHDHAAHDTAAGHDAARHAADGAATLGPISVKDGFVRAAVTEGGASAAYMTITTTGEADRLIAASSPAARKVELHTHTLDAAGVARMRQVEAIDLTADAPAVLAPGGLHVMMMGLVAPLTAGEAAELTLIFEKAGAVTFTAPVVATGAPAASGGHEHGAAPDHNHGDHKQGDHQHGDHKHGG